MWIDSNDEGTQHIFLDDNLWIDMRDL